MQLIPNRLLIFTKAGIPGQVKTRLIADLGVAQATRVHDVLLQHLSQQVRQLRGVDIQMCCAPTATHSYFSNFHWRKQDQQGGDLGERMFNALRHALGEAEKVVLVGSDCPGLTASYISRAFYLLDYAEGVLGPAEDGGYALIGLKCVDRTLFEGISWGGESVLEQTLQRIDALGWSVHLLDSVWDVDYPDDLRRLQARFPLIGAE